MKGRGMKCVLIVLGVLTRWLSCLPYPCWEHNRTPGSMPARPRRSFTPKKWFEYCSSSNIAIKLVLGSGSELELEWFLWKKRNALKTSARARSQNCAGASDFRQSWKTPWKSPTSHLITTSFGWFLFCCFPRFPCDFIPPSMPRRLSLPDAICFQAQWRSFSFLNCSSPGLDCCYSVTPVGWWEGHCGLQSRNEVGTQQIPFLDLDMDASFLGLRPQGLV